MTDKEMMLQILMELGMSDAKALREKAKDMTATEIIDQEYKIPPFDSKKDYTSCPVGTPVTDGDQVFGLIQPYNAASYSGTPMTLRAIWSLLHTKNPLKAKSWVEPQGTSGMYMKDEVYLDDDGHVYRCNTDNCVWNHSGYASYWDDLGTLESLKEGS